MMRILAALVILLTGLMNNSVLAQEPKVTVTAEQEEVVVGQPYLLRIEILVPTFMPKAPVFPTFEMPGLIVRLPEKSTSPISEKIDGETWSGVRRTYRIFPTRAGITEIAAQQLSITYKDTDTNEDVPLTVDVPATQLLATVPAGARALDPLIVAQDVGIAQTWQVGEGELAVGDAVVRTLEISVAGASALFVPPLLDNASPEPEAAEGEEAGPDDVAVEASHFLPYPEDAQVTETIERGIMSGTRHEQVSYIAQGGGETVFPDITLSWYNLETEKVEEIVLPGKSVTVAMPPVVRAPLDTGKILRLGIFAVIVAGLFWALHKFLWPLCTAKYYQLRTRYDATTHAAHRAAVKQANARDLNGLLVALDVRTHRGCAPGPEVTQAINGLTQSIYRDGTPASDTTGEWSAIQKALKAERPSVFAGPRKLGGGALPSLNPYTDATPRTVFFEAAPKE